jgi:hypothetical protein
MGDESERLLVVAEAFRGELAPAGTAKPATDVVLNLLFEKPAPPELLRKASGREPVTPEDKAVLAEFGLRRLALG